MLLAVKKSEIAPFKAVELYFRLLRAILGYIDHNSIQFDATDMSHLVSDQLATMRKLGVWIRT